MKGDSVSAHVHMKCDTLLSLYAFVIIFDDLPPFPSYVDT